jgi:hypothetical protein
VFFYALYDCYQALILPSACIDSKKSSDVPFQIVILISSFFATSISVNIALTVDNRMIEGGVQRGDEYISPLKLIPLFAITTALNYGLNYLHEYCKSDYSLLSENNEIALAGNEVVNLQD